MPSWRNALIKLSNSRGPVQTRGYFTGSLLRQFSNSKARHDVLTEQRSRALLILHSLAQEAVRRGWEVIPNPSTFEVERWNGRRKRVSPGPDLFSIVAGGTDGVEASAHRAALARNGSTIAVLAAGFDRPYQAGHTDLIDRIARQVLVISEVRPGFSPTRQRCIDRSRILAAISSASVVVEAGARSGTLHTARETLTLGRAVGAVPGPVTSAASTGTNRLLEVGQAQVTTSGSDVVRLLGCMRDAVHSAPDLNTTRLAQAPVTLHNMCGRVIVDYEEMIPAAADTELAAWVTGTPSEAASSWNLKPTQQMPVAYTDHKTGEKKFETAYWSFVPVWSKKLKTKFPTFNARSERSTEKPTFKTAVKNRNCAITVSGFYEWSGPKSTPIPQAIFGPEKILTLAGLMSWWHKPDADDDRGWHLTATILTCDSAGVMKPLHDRMPVFLADQFVIEWINPNIIGDHALLEAVSAAAAPIADGLFECPVAPLRGDGPPQMEAVIQ